MSPLVKKTVSYAIDQLSQCCGCIPLKIGTLVIGILDLVWSILNMIAVLYTALWDSAHFAHEMQVTPQESTAILLSFLTLRILQASFAALLIVGIIESKAKYMVPWMIFNVLELVLLFVSFIVFIYTDSKEPEKGIKNLGALLGIFAYLIMVVYKHYRSVKKPILAEPDSSPLMETDAV